MAAGEAPRAWSGLAVALCDDRAVLTSEGARLLLPLLADVERRHGRDGISLSPQLAHVRKVLELVANQAGCGHADVRNASVSAESSQWISTEEAAVAIKRSSRQVRRMAASGILGQTRKVGGKRLVLASEVDAYVAERVSA